MKVNLLNIANFFARLAAAEAGQGRHSASPTGRGSPDPTQVSDRKNAISLLIESIKDIQGTIRAIDVKLNTLIVVLTLPLTRLSEMTAIVGSAYNHEVSQGRPYTVIAACVLVVGAWLIAYLVAFVALFGTYNPAINITGRPPLDFFLGGLYQQRFLDLFFPPAHHVGRRLHDYAALFQNDSDEATIATLAFEQMKLALIRDIKSYRHRFVARYGLLGLASGAAAYVLAYYFKVI